MDCSRPSRIWLEALAADVLHDDVAQPVVLDEVEDLDDVRVLDLGQKPPFGQSRRGRVRVVGVDQPLEHDPPIGHVAIARQVDPTHAAMGQATDDLVLTGDEIAGRQLPA